MGSSSEAGTVILACTVAMWLLLSFPRDATIAAVESSLPAGEEPDERIAAVKNERSGEALRPATVRPAEIVVGLLRPPGTSAQRESSKMR